MGMKIHMFEIYKLYFLIHNILQTKVMLLTKGELSANEPSQNNNMIGPENLKNHNIKKFNCCP